MKTTTAKFEFSYELLLEDGVKVTQINTCRVFGADNASVFIKLHGIKAPSTVSILKWKEVTRPIVNIPFYQKATPVEFFNKKNTYKDLEYPYSAPVVDVHLTYKRVA